MGIMRAGTIHILDLDFEYKYWKNKLYFFRSEIEILEGRMQVLKLENSSYFINKENLTLIDAQKVSIKTLLNRINVLEEEMALYAEDYPIESTHSHFVSHRKIRLDMTKVIKRQSNLIDNLLPIFSYHNI